MKYFFNCSHRQSQVSTLVFRRGLRWLGKALAAVITYVLDDHDEEGKLDGQSFLRVDWAGDEVGGDIGAHDFEHRGLDVRIRQSLDVAVAHLLVPDLQRLRAETKMEGLGRKEGLTRWSRGSKGNRSGRST